MSIFFSIQVSFIFQSQFTSYVILFFATIIFFLSWRRLISSFLVRNICSFNATLRSSFVVITRLDFFILSSVQAAINLLFLDVKKDCVGKISFIVYFWCIYLSYFLISLSQLHFPLFLFHFFHFFFHLFLLQFIFVFTNIFLYKFI